MLVVDAEKRLSLKQIIKHKWMVSHSSSNRNTQDKSIPENNGLTDITHCCCGMAVNCLKRLELSESIVNSGSEFESVLCQCCTKLCDASAVSSANSELNRTVIKHMLTLPGLTLDMIKQVIVFFSFKVTLPTGRTPTWRPLIHAILQKTMIFLFRH